VNTSFYLFQEIYFTVRWKPFKEFKTSTRYDTDTGFDYN